MIRVGARASRLAQAQTRWVIERIRGVRPELAFEIVPIRTEGDVDRSTPLPQMGGRGVFVGEVERALLEGRVDFAVHSLKDLPVKETEGLVVAAVPRREDPRDALITRAGLDVFDLPEGARVGTGSPRRQAQLAAVRPDLSFVGIRGNVETRAAKVAQGEFDATVLAVAGLNRSGIAPPARPIPLSIMLPAPGQGALAVQCRSDDQELRSVLERIDDADDRLAVAEERRLLTLIRGGCHAPVGALCRRDADGWRFEAAVLADPNEPLRRVEVRGDAPQGLADRAFALLDLA